MQRTGPDELLARVREQTGGRGADIVLDCSGVRRPSSTSLRMARVGGHVVEAGAFVDLGPVEINPNADICTKNVTVLGIGGETAESYMPAMELLVRNLDRLPLERFVSHRLPLEDAQGAVELAQRDEAMKVVLSPAAWEDRIPAHDGGPRRPRRRDHLVHRFGLHLTRVSDRGSDAHSCLGDAHRAPAPVGDLPFSGRPASRPGQPSGWCSPVRETSGAVDPLPRASDRPLGRRHADRDHRGRDRRRARDHLRTGGGSTRGAALAVTVIGVTLTGLGRRPDEPEPAAASGLLARSCRRRRSHPGGAGASSPQRG